MNPDSLVEMEIRETFDTIEKVAKTIELHGEFVGELIIEEDGTRRKITDDEANILNDLIPQPNPCAERILAKPDRETEKALCFVTTVTQFSTGQIVTRDVWIPKCKVNNGKVVRGLIDEKTEEMRHSMARRYDKPYRTDFLDGLVITGLVEHPVCLVKC